MEEKLDLTTPTMPTAQKLKAEDYEAFTSNLATFLMNTVCETIEFIQTPSVAMEHIYKAFNDMAQTIDNKEVDIERLENGNPFIYRAAIDLLTCINDLEDDAPVEENYEKVKQAFIQLRDDYAQNENCSFVEMTPEELENLGFVHWAESTSLHLIPIWAYRLLDGEQELTSINGHKAKAFDEAIRVDRPFYDIRFGHLGWGIIPKEAKEENDDTN